MEPWSEVFFGVLFFLESECMSLKVRSLPENYLKALSIKDHNTCTISK